MEQRIRKVVELEKRLVGGNLTKEESAEISKELSALLNVSIGDIPEYAVWRGDNKEELDAFISDCARLEYSRVSTDSRASEMEYHFRADSKSYRLRLLDIISNDGGLFRPIIEYPFRELDVVGKSVLFNGSDSIRKRFKAQTWPLLCSLSTYQTYEDRETGEVVRALPWTGKNVAVFKESVKMHGFRIEDWGEAKRSGDYGYGKCVHIANRGENFSELFIPVGGYFVEKRNPKYYELNLLIGGCLFTSPSELPRYIFEGLGAEDFDKKYVSVG